METWKGGEKGLPEELGIQTMAGKQLQEHEVNEICMWTTCRLSLKFIIHEGLQI